VPADASAIRGKSYQSAAAPDDWGRGDAGVGFPCLWVRAPEPQFFQYSYTATNAGFTVTAHGDLNGDGVLSTFEMDGTIKGRTVSLSRLRETNPLE
jgi:hypothetical protein